MEENSKIKEDIFDKELELYKKYYEVDTENRIIKMVFHFDSSLDIVEKETSTPERPRIKHEVLEKISDKVRSIPEMYRADIVLEIKDYGPYSNKQLVESIKDSLSFIHFHSDRDFRRNCVIAALFTLIGLVILLFAAFLSSDSFAWVESTNGTIIKEILDIAAWVFIWEAVSILFISPDPEKLIEKTLKLKMRALTITNPDGSDSLTSDEAYFHDAYPWRRLQIKKIGRYLLLISGFLMIATGITSVFFLFSSLIPEFRAVINGENATFQGNNMSVAQMMFVMIFAVIISVVLLALRIVGGIAGVYKFNGRGKLQKFVAPYAIIMLVYHTISFVVLSLGGSSTAVGSWLSNGFSTALNLVYLTGYFMDRLGQYPKLSDF